MTVSIDVFGVPSSERSFRGAQFTSDMSLGLWQKKQFRAYREFTTTTVMNFVATKNILLTYQSLFLTAGAAKAVVSNGGTPGGTFTAIPTKFCKYTLDGPIAGNTTIGVGGTITSSVERDVLISASGAGVGIGNSIGGSRVLLAGTYYFTITVTGTTAGIYTLEWEELD